MNVFRSVSWLVLLAALPAWAAEVKVLEGTPGDAVKMQLEATPPSAEIAKPRKETRVGNVPGSADPKPSAKGANAIINRLEFRDAKLVDVIRALADMSGLNIVATKEAANREVTLFLQEITVKDALETIVKNSGLWFRQDKTGKTYRIMTTEEYQQDVVVFREDETRIFNLLHPNPMVVATAIRDLYGSRVILTLGIEDPSSGLSAASIIASGGRGGGAGGGAGNRAGGGGAAARNAARAADRAAAQGTGGAGQVSEQAVSEKMTADQLQKLEQAASASADGKVSAEALRQITNSEQPVYITINREHNLVLVRTSDSIAMKEIERLIKEMDRPTPQVLLEMKVLELSVGDTFRQVFDIEAESLTANQFHTFTGGGANANETSSFIYTFINNSIQAKLELLQKNNQVNNLSSPVLLASNNRPARVFVGDEWVLVKGVTVTDPVLQNGVVITPAKITYELEDRDVGNTLTILPKINADRTVTLAVQHDSSIVNIGAITLPPLTVNNQNLQFKIDAVKTATIEGTVIAKDGLTVAIGGLISTSYSEDVRKIPLLGDMPLIGNLFRNVDQIASKKELVLLITPRIITNPMEGVAATEEQMDNLPLEVKEW
jgi:general secretion pathway protein D